MKPALFIYRDGRIKHTGRVHEKCYVREAEIGRTSVLGFAHLTPDARLPYIERTLRYVGDAGPFSVFAED